MNRSHPRRPPRPERPDRNVGARRAIAVAPPTILNLVTDDGRNLVTDDGRNLTTG